MSKEQAAAVVAVSPPQVRPHPPLRLLLRLRAAAVVAVRPPQLRPHPPLRLLLRLRPSRAPWLHLLYRALRPSPRSHPQLHLLLRALRRRDCPRHDREL